MASEKNNVDGGIPLFGWVLFFSGMVLLGSYSPMALMAETSNGSAPIPIPLSILLIEFIKFIVSAFRLSVDINSVGGVWNEIGNLSWGHIWPYAIPGLLYMINNNTEIFVLKYMDPATFRLLNNGKIVTTALLFRTIMNKEITKQQMLALFLLTFGASLASMSSKGGDAAGTGDMFVNPIGLVILFVYCMISGLASVVNEWIMKKGAGSEKSVHLQNMILYGWGLVFNLAGALSMNRQDNIGFENDSQVFWWWAFILNGALHGLVISFMMKYLSSIYKLFMSASSIFVAGLLQKYMLGASSLPPTFFLSAGLVTVALYLYNTPGVLGFSPFASVTPK